MFEFGISGYKLLVICLCLVGSKLASNEKTMNEELNYLSQRFQVNVVIWEGRHLAMTNADSKVIISIDKNKKIIRSKNNKTDCPYFNDFCIFPFRLPLNVLLDKILTVKVYQKTIIKKLVGSFSVELATVWSQPNHQFYHKWAVLVNPKNPAGGVKGFLKCDIVVLARGVTVMPTDNDDNYLENNLLVPYGGIQDRIRTRIVLSVFRADSFSPNFAGQLKLAQPYVKITYGGSVRKTSIAKNQGAPVWNEELSFPDLFPPLMQTLFIEIFDYRQSQKSIGNTTIDIRGLYEDGSEGFLPTFGPNFLYLYQPLEKFQRHKNCCSPENSFTYAGRLLLSLRTEVIDKFDKELARKRKPKIGPKAIPPLNERVYFEYNKFILFAAIFDALLFDANLAGRNIKIQMRMGPKQNFKTLKIKDQKNKIKFRSKKKSRENPNKQTSIKKAQKASKKKSQERSGKESPKHLTVITNCDSTPGENCTIKEDYSYITFSGNFPCVNIFGEWPDSLKRMYCSNVLKKTIQKCANELNEIKYELQFQTENDSLYSQKLKATLENLSKSCEHILLLTRVINLNQTNLCRERKMTYHKIIADIAYKTKMASNQHALRAEEELNKISTYLDRLMKYAQDPENSFPNTEIWLLRNNKIEAQYRIKTEDLAFSHDFNYRGIMSGKTQTIIFKGKNGKIKGKLDILIWFGLAKEFNECLKMLPDGLNKNNPVCSSIPDFKIPTRLICDEKHYFQCKAYIFQGKIFFGFDSTGLTDAFVRVIIHGQNKKTNVRKSTLSPIWDETLVFSSLTLYGPPEYIKKNPPCITVELFDKDNLKKSELIGRCFVKPLINFKKIKHNPPISPVKLKWEPVNDEFREVGQILMAAELLELSDDSTQLDDSKHSVPENIRPHYVKYRLEILFWGVRPLKEKKCLKNKVFVVFECGGSLVKSPILHNIRHKLNFSGPIQNVELNLPKELEYAPPFNFKLFHIGSITHKRTYVATCMVPSIKYLLLRRTTFLKTEEEDKKYKSFFVKEVHKEKKKIMNWWRKKKVSDVEDVKQKTPFSFFSFASYFKFNRIGKKFPKFKIGPQPKEAEEPMSWWLRYHASDENFTPGYGFSNVPRLKIYRGELEAQPEFRGFQDFLQNYNMVTGHDKKTKGGILMAKVKAVLKLHKFTQTKEKEKNAEKGFLLTAFSNKTFKFVARVYIVCGKNLAARDIYGKSDPYLFLRLGKHTINDREHYAPKQLNPTFGKCFEFHGVFPHDYLLRIKVCDHDIHSSDDLIGETSIDLENRFYSKFHATCGLGWPYERTGFNFWRDIYLPTEILNTLCKQLNLKQPLYEENAVVIEGHTFATPVSNDLEDKVEIQSLMVLKNWHEMPVYGFHLVPEHVETRSLYHPSLPGIEQGKLVLWVDIFPADFTYMPPKVDITPHPPIAMELRAIVWNVVDVVLDDKSLLFNGRLSDIYVKGWILSLEEDIQKTDIHYRSLNGEGNFNWRFIFQFNYIPVERRMTVRKKMNAFDMNPEERKVHCKLEIQVWDNDAFGDDFLGTLILELCSMPNGAKLPHRCTLKMLAPNARTINLFNIKRTRGWWPFRRLKMKETVGNEFELTGKIDLELEILTEGEAVKSPAGKGRKEPNALPPPDRPEISAHKILNPLKAFRYIILNRAGKWIVLVIIIVFVVFFLVIAIYSFPNYVVKKLLRA